MANYWNRANLALIACAATWGIVAAPAHGAEWRPDRPVEIVIAAGAGGPQDYTGRVIERIMKANKLIDVPAVVVNKPGGGGSLGYSYLNDHKGDGHYIGISSTVLLSSHILGNTPIGYNELTPVAHLYSEYVAFSVRADSPIKTGKDLFDRLKADPTSLTLGTSNALGNPNHLAAVQVVQAAGGNPQKLKTVIHQAGSEVVTALLGGHVDFATVTASTVLEHKKAGTIRVIAISAPERTGGDFADVPTWLEQGVNSVSENWRGVMGPGGMTPEQTKYWDNVFARLTSTPEWKAELEKNQWVSNYKKHTDAAAFYDKDSNNMKGVLQTIGMIK